ncbi:MAG: tRNA (adenosine(37)-N6)-threonylcarbamoyltransferase complex ATPase subunit type 1 TsaE [Fretibacterium sp.]|nr:tRNA (adenosine(37)-N6)-threonylcarbamoyltransferase complex ATPase subunit type 1 TsaE [Fretibacterium sp.]
MTHPFTLLSSSGEATRSLGEALGRALEPGAVVLLDGDLGTGKTVLVRGAGGALGASGVRSPSFTLVNEYRTKGGLLLVHADLYRLETEGVEALDLEDYLAPGDAALLVEWPERWAFPPEDALRLELRVPDEPGGEWLRRVTFRPGGPQAEGVAARVLAAVEAGDCPGVKRVMEAEDEC